MKTINYIPHIEHYEKNKSMITAKFTLISSLTGKYFKRPKGDKLCRNSSTKSEDFS